MSQPNIVKIVILGTSGVGKSSIINRYIYDHWDKDMQTTLGAAFLDKTLTYRGKHFKFQIWDTAGQEKYGPLAQMYYRDADVAILVYDVTEKSSFSGMKAWHTELKEKGPKNIILAIVGNKIEMEDEIITKIDGEIYASKHNAIFKATSAKENQGINELFDCILDQLLDHSGAVEIMSEMSTSKLSKRQKKDNDGVIKRCCF